MADKKIGKNKKIIWAALFVLAVFLPHVFWAIFCRYADSTNYEKREPAAMPVIGETDYSEFSTAIEAHYNDNLPFRNELIKLNNLISYKLFSRSESENVVIGKDDWLFYDNADDGDPLADYERTVVFEDVQLEKITANLMELQKYAEENNAIFILFIVPNKENVYSEYLPDYVTVRREGLSRCEQLTAYLEANTNIRVIYPLEEFRALKAEYPQYPLYYKHDTHWTKFGAYAGTRILLSELGITMPDFNEVAISRCDYSGADLLGMLNLSGLYTDEDYSISAYGGAASVTAKMDFNTEYIMSSDAADERKIFVIRDSFALNMAEYVSAYFAETYMPHRSAYFKPKMLTDKKPDIIIVETAERYLYQLSGGFDINGSDDSEAEETNEEKKN